jgi:hypothetical protein
MAPRLALQQLLEDTLESTNVYFQPPPNVSMAYPCIVYGREYGVTQFADNDPYRFTKRYQVTYIDRDPDSEVLDKLAMLRMCTFIRSYAANGLNHDIFTIYF